MLKNIEETHAECASLKQARDEIEAVVIELNEQKRQAEDTERLMQTVAKIKSDEVCFPRVALHLDYHFILVFDPTISPFFPPLYDAAT